MTSLLEKVIVASESSSPEYTKIEHPFVKELMVYVEFKPLRDTLEYTFYYKDDNNNNHRSDLELPADFIENNGEEYVKAFIAGWISADAGWQIEHDNQIFGVIR